MKLYFRLLINFVFVAAILGFIGPALISAADTFLVLLGLAIIFIVMPIGLYYGNKTFVINFLKGLNNED